MSYYENRIKALEEKVAEMARMQRHKAIPVEAKLVERIAEYQAKNTRLKADAQLVVKHLDEACADNLRLKADVVELSDALKLASEVGIKVADEVMRLKAEVERLRASSFVTAVPVEQYERLIKAGDAVCESPYLWETDPAVIAWRAAKEGKPSV